MASSPRDAVGSVVKLTISSNGTPLDETIQIISVSVSKAINKIPSARLVILDGDMPTQTFPVSDADTFKPGSAITISAGYDQEAETIFDGVVIGYGIEISGNNYSRLVIDCRDKAVAMTIGRKNANYVDQKDSDIIGTLIGNYGGLSADVGATATQHKELVQYYCTDWDFMLARAEVCGLLVNVDAGKLTVKAPDTSAAPELKVSYGDDLMEFHADMDARTQLSQVTGVAWNPTTQAVVEEQVSPQTLNSQGNLAASDLAAVINLAAYRLQTAVPLEQSALKDWAAGRQVKAGLSRIRGEMKFQGSAKARPGGLIELDGVGARYSGNVFVSAVRHDIVNGNWTTDVAFGMSPDWFAERRDLTAPPAAGLLPGVEGLQIGVVLKLDADPEGEFKVQVSVPLMQAATDGVWARLAKFYASDGIGAFFIPEIGDEVVLGYLNNDPSYPVILGSLYSSKRKTPYPLTADNFTKALVTKSQLKVEFDDDKKVVTIVTPGANTIVISDDDKSILLKDQNNNSVKLSSDGIVLTSAKDIKLTAQGQVSITATGNASITSQADVKIEGLNINNNANVGFVAKGSASAELSASGQTTVKGAMVMIN